jgi:hypothetical protein
MMRFDYQVVPHWPVSAWLARCPRSTPRVEVFHGRQIEIADDWFSEAAWAGEYVAGGFDETDIVAGSGGRLRGSGVTFVSSGSTVDRLNALENRDAVWVSNSLACLLSVLGGTVDPCYGRYYEDFYSVVDGIDKYKRTLATSAGTVQFIYFDNARWDGASLTVERKPGGSLELTSYDRYLDFLQRSMRLLSENLASGARRHPYRMLATVSSGYDSPTVTALAQRAGCREALCFDRSHKGEDDSGEVIAGHLGVQPIRVRGTAWRDLEFPEVPFLSSNGMGEEVRFSRLAGRVLLTGYHGDKMWDPHTKALAPTLVRGDPSGLSLTEYRLWTGFLHCPVPFWGARQIRAVNGIGKSTELRPWDVGGDYSRPICRRIVEESGVPRGLFGVSKRNASVMLHNYREFLTPSSTEDFMSWLRAHRRDWIKGGRIPPIASPTVDRVMYLAAESFAAWAKRKPGLWRLAGLAERRPTYLRRYVFPWAIERAKERYMPLPAQLPGQA